MRDTPGDITSGPATLASKSLYRTVGLGARGHIREYRIVMLAVCGRVSTTSGPDAAWLPTIEMPDVNMSMVMLVFTLSVVTVKGFSHITFCWL